MEAKDNMWCRLSGPAWQEGLHAAPPLTPCSAHLQLLLFHLRLPPGILVSLHQQRQACPTPSHAAGLSGYLMAHRTHTHTHTHLLTHNSKL